MRWIFFALLYPFVCHADPQYVNIDVQDTCVNWSTFPTKEWVNDTGQTIEITDTTMAFASAASLVGEMGMWVTRTGRPAFLYSYGVEVYMPPSQPLISVEKPEKDARYTLLPGESIVVMTNCGPVFGVPWKQYKYFAVVKFHYITKEPQ